MGAGHLLAGHLDPATAPTSGARPVDLLLNWVVPIVLVLAALRYTTNVTTAGTDEPPKGPITALAPLKPATQPHRQEYSPPTSTSG